MRGYWWNSGASSGGSTPSEPDFSVLKNCLAQNMRAQTALEDTSVYLPLDTESVVAANHAVEKLYGTIRISSRNSLFIAPGVNYTPEIGTHTGYAIRENFTFMAFDYVENGYGTGAKDWYKYNEEKTKALLTNQSCLDFIKSHKGTVSGKYSGSGGGSSVMKFNRKYASQCVRPGGGSWSFNLDANQPLQASLDYFKAFYEARKDSNSSITDVGFSAYGDWRVECNQRAFVKVNPTDENYVNLYPVMAGSFKVESKGVITSYNPTGFSANPVASVARLRPYAVGETAIKPVDDAPVLQQYKSCWMLQLIIMYYGGTDYA